MKKSLLKRSLIPLKRTPLKKTSSRAKEKQIDRKKERAEDEIFYNQIWKSRGHRCELTGNYLGDEIMVIFFHHLLPKSLYPQYRHKDWNILQVQAKIHDQIEVNPNKLPEDLYDKFIGFLNKAKKMAGIL